MASCIRSECLLCLRRLCCAVVFAVALGAGVVAAQSPAAATGLNAEGHGCISAVGAIGKARGRFAEGEEAYAKGDDETAFRRFDDAVDIILSSGCDIRSDGALQVYYEMLVDQIHRYQLLAFESDRLVLQTYEATPFDDIGVAGASLASVTRPGARCDDRFALDSPATVLAKLSVGIRPKGEFETTAEYEHYMQALETNLALRTAKYTFAIPESAVDVTYDADEALFTIVVKDVYAVEGKDRSIVVVQLDGPETLRIHAEPQVARLAKGTMDVMVVGHARYESRERGGGAEWVGLYGRALYITRDEIIVVHRPSGCVVGRWSLVPVRRQPLIVDFNDPPEVEPLPLP